MCSCWAAVRRTQGFITTTATTTTIVMALITLALCVGNLAVPPKKTLTVSQPIGPMPHAEPRIHFPKPTRKHVSIKK